MRALALLLGAALLAGCGSPAAGPHTAPTRHSSAQAARSDTAAGHRLARSATVGLQRLLRTYSAGIPLDHDVALNQPLDGTPRAPGARGLCQVDLRHHLMAVAVIAYDGADPYAETHPFRAGRGRAAVACRSTYAEVAAVAAGQ